MIDAVKKMFCAHKFKSIGHLYTGYGGMIVIRECKKCGLKRSELI